MARGRKRQENPGFAAKNPWKSPVFSTMTTFSAPKVDEIP